MQPALAVKPEAPPKPMCPVHPDAVAIGTCNRCGRYICDPCGQDAWLCTACRQLRLSAMGSSGVASVLSAVGLGGIAFLAIIKFLLAAVCLFFVSQETAIEMANGLVILVGLEVLGMLATAIVFWIWSYQAVKQANAIGIDVGTSPGGAIGWWFVPFASLVKPYRTISNLLGSLQGWEAQRSAGVGIWWGFWIANNVLWQITSRLDANDGSFYVFTLLQGLCAAVSAIFAIRVVLAIQRALEGRRNPTFGMAQ